MKDVQTPDGMIHPSSFRISEALARRPQNAKIRVRRGGRVADCTGLENRQHEGVRGFESLPLRFRPVGWV